MAEAQKKYRTVVSHDDYQWQVVTGYGRQLRIVMCFPGVDSAAKERADNYCANLNMKDSE